MRYLPLLFALLYSIAGSAQFESTTFMLPDVAADNNTNVCLPVTVLDFTAGIEFGFSLLVDPGGGLSNPSVQNINPAIPGFGLDNFDLVTYSASGLITVRWRNWDPALGETCADAPNSITLPNGTVLFEVCYDVSGGVATQHQVEFFNKPDDDPDDGIDDAAPVLFNKPAQCNMGNDAFPAIDDGSVTIGVSPLQLAVIEDDGIYQPGDVYCVDIMSLSGFANLEGYQFGLQFDTAVLEVISATPNNEILGGTNQVSNYNLFDGSVFYGIWNVTFGQDAQTIPDSTRLVTVCFDVVGDCSSSTDIIINSVTFTNGNTGVLVASATGINELPIVTSSARLNVDACNPAGFDVIVDCPTTPVNFGDTDICIPIRAGDDFVDMTDIDYLITWDPTVLQFTRVQGFNGSIFNLNDDEFIVDQVSNGVLGFEWEAFSPTARETLGEGEIVYEICFDAIGFGGISPVTIADFNNNIRSNNELGSFMGLNPSNCAIEVQQPEGVAVMFPDVGFSSTQSSCFDIDVDGFTDVTSFTLFVNYPSPLFDYVDFTAAIPGVTATLVTDGLVQLQYSGNTLNLLDGTSLGSLCLQAKPTANPTDCDFIGLATFIPSSVVTNESAGNSVSVQSIEGEGCVLFPNGYGLIAEELSGFINDQVCVPFSVTRFTDVVTTNFNVNFDPALLDYGTVNFSGAWPGLTLGNVDASGSGLGVLNFNWSTPNPAGANIATTDTVQVFEICFNADATPDCSIIGLSDGAPIATTTATGDGSIVYNDGEICLEDRLILLSIEVIPASCEGADDGAIVFEVAPRPSNEDVFIRVDNPVRFGNSNGGIGPNGGITGTIGGLLPGLQSFDIYDQFNTVNFADTITIGVNPANAAVAMAGDDQTLSCGDNASAVISSQGNVGTTFSLFFLQANGITRLEREGNVAFDGNIVTSVTDPGTYILEVTSTAGCTDRDTVMVTGVGQPIADANTSTELVIDCNTESVTLNGIGSSAGANVTYLWERINGVGDVLETIGTNITESVSRAGRYRLTVEFVNLQCTSTDQIIVFDRTQVPNSVLPTSTNLNCDGSPVILSIGAPEEDVTYAWTQAGTPSSILSAANTLTTSETGTYIAAMENTVTGCTRMDTIVVEVSAGIPTISFAPSVSLNCEPDTTVLAPTFGNVNENTDYRWSTADGRVVITDRALPNPRIVLPGTYQVIVSNGACLDSATVVVSEPIAPSVEAGMGGELDCSVDFQLSGSGTSDQGNEVAFQWFFGEEEVPMGAAATVNVNAAGTYYFQVTDQVTGCSAVDSVIINPPSGLPVYMLPDTINGLGCSGDTLTIAVQTNNPDYAYRWSNESGETVGEERRLAVGDPGIYTVEITDPTNGCSTTDQVLVVADQTDVPFVAFRQNTLDITCETRSVWIDATPSTDGPTFEYIWENVVGGEIPNAQGNDSLRVRTAGTYRLTITNLVTSCSNSREVEVTDSQVFPQVEAVEGMTLTCDLRETVIGINILDQPNNFQIQWAGSIGVDSLPSDTNRITVTQGGSYNAVVINPVTSCVSTVAIRVEDLADSIANIVIMPTDSFDCNNTTISIDASDTELNNAAAQGIAWASLDGNTVTPPTGSLIVSVNGPGAYELAITDATGCTVRDTVNVPASRDTPFAQAGEDLEVECGAMPQLDGSASSPPPGSNVLYTWTAANGGEIISGGDGPMPFVSGPGQYQLIVSNLTNGCADTSLTNVVLSEQAAAMLPPPFTSCAAPVTVTGNLPDGTTGVWTTFNDEGATVTFADNVATISTLAEGISLVWTLSAGAGCENYSSDTTRVAPEEAPNANNDGLEVGGTDNVGSVNVLANDQRTGPVTVTLLNEPEFGTILSNLNGEITFEAPVGLTGTTTIDYEICSTVCEGLCDQASILIRSDADGADPQVFNAITPNGDGLNETFIFDILDLRPDDFPNNELIIFNRWGDVIFEAKPYNNDWSGLNNSGTMVPEGTYYYILRLNIGEGDIIRGDVTVVR